jgi:hypothetical protein
MYGVLTADLSSLNMWVRLQLQVYRTQVLEPLDSISLVECGPLTTDYIRLVYVGHLLE